MKHLGQIKYILPEAIQIDNIIVHDKKTLCMKPAMKISLLFDVVEGHSEHSDFMALRQAFASRLMNYFTSHPEVLLFSCTGAFCCNVVSRAAHWTTTTPLF